MKKERRQTINIKNEIGVISVELTNIKIIITEYYVKFYAKYLIT